MASRSGGTDPSEAFELFLDTISNAFGGIVFITIMVCIQLPHTGPMSASPRAMQDPVESARLKTKLESVNKRAAENEAYLNSLRQELTDQAAKPDQGAASEYAQLEAEYAEHVARSAMSGRSEQEKDDAIRKLEQTLRETQDRNRTMQSQIDAANETMRETARRAAVRLRFPSARATTKEAVGILVSGGRVAFHLEYGQGAIPRDVNRADIEGELPRPGIRLKPGRGMLILDTTFKQDFRQKLGRFKPDKHFFQIAVWPDSYKEFAVIRELLLDDHFGYCPLLPAEGDAVQGGGASVEM